jgi:predicted PurR-regulated permease PerM
MMNAINNLIITIVIANVVYFILDSLVPSMGKVDVFRSIAQIIITCIICVQIVNILGDLLSIDFSISSLFSSSQPYENITFDDYIKKYKEIILPYLE